MAKKFTSAEIKVLEKNPNTLKVTDAHLSLTKAAKEEALVLIREGLSACQIMKKLGYDTKMLGKPAGAQVASLRCPILPLPR